MRKALLASVAVLGLAGCGSSSSTTATGGSGSPGGSVRAASCHSVQAPPPKPSPHLRKPVLILDPSRTYKVTVATNCGSFAFTLDVKDSPKTSASFYSLVKRGFFDGLTFHRVAAGFVIQGGDPTGTGGGGPGYTVVEAPSPNLQYTLGTVAMAKTQTQPPGASGSQFFIVTAVNATRSAGLTPDYALLGHIVSGQSVVDTIGALPTNPAADGSPQPPVVMSSVTVSES